MRITKLSLTNFRSFKATQTIDFAPTTLLFGPNSVGKSSVLMALFYVHQILAKGQCNPMYLEALGNKYVGGFKNLVNGRDLNKTITIRIDFDKQGSIGKSYWNTLAIDEVLNADFGRYDMPLFSDIAYSVKSSAVELEIAWSASENTAYVKRYTVWLNDEQMIEVSCDAGLKQVRVSKLNYLHHLFIEDSDIEHLLDIGNHYDDVHLIHEEKLKATLSDDLLEDMALNKELYVNEEGWCSELNNYISGEQPALIDFAGYKQQHGMFAILGNQGALPLLNSTIYMSQMHEHDTINEVVRELLSDMLVAPLDNLLSLLNESVCIGPLRAIPDGEYQPNPYPSSCDWHNGIAAWDKLQMIDDETKKQVNDWMSSSQKLCLGYGLAEKAMTQTMAIQPISQNADSSMGVDVSVTQNSTQTCLWDYQNKIDVTAADVGVGVSQVFPVVMAAHIVSKGVIAVEQPELHVHPRVQVGLGDLFTQSGCKAGFLIETHSEHLILRLLRRIRETTDSELGEGLKPVLPDMVSIIYLDNSEEGVCVRKINIDEDGEFTSRWPDGFFSERREELF